LKISVLRAKSSRPLIETVEQRVSCSHGPCSIHDPFMIHERV
jgi:3-deoxy-D-arabino-heptulosonate 7-phosphate (DAHP) synthase